MPKKEGIRKLFDDIAPDYDRLNHIMSLDIDKSWRRKAVRRIVCKDSPVEVLDVASGTGDFAIAIARKAYKGSRICGLDLSEGMLEIGRKKIEAAGLSEDITMMQGDCEALPFQDGSFDRVSVAFGIRNFEHQSVGLSEMCRVLRPGGRLVILELSHPDNKILDWGFRLYSTKIMPAIGGLISGNRGAYEYLPASIFRFPKQDVILPMLHDAGFSTAEHKAFSFGICRMYVARK